MKIYPAEVSVCVTFEAEKNKTTTRNWLLESMPVDN